MRSHGNFYNLVRRWSRPFSYKFLEMKTLICLIFALFFSSSVFGQQEQRQKVRLAKLVIDSTQLETYNAFLREEIDTSIKLEPGVLTLYAVAERDNPTHITILEIYADDEAYQKHIQTPHFLKYKNGTKDMVESLELIETVPLIPGMKIK